MQTKIKVETHCMSNKLQSIKTIYFMKISKVKTSLAYYSFVLIFSNVNFRWKLNIGHDSVKNSNAWRRGERGNKGEETLLGYNMGNTKSSGKCMNKK
jgi:hypothetical protein